MTCISPHSVNYIYIQVFLHGDVYGISGASIEVKISPVEVLVCLPGGVGGRVCGLIHVSRVHERYLRWGVDGG